MENAGINREFLAALPNGWMAVVCVNFCRCWHWDGATARNLEKAMRQALSENMANAERVRQLVNRENYASNISATSNLYPSEVKVILPDLSRFDELRLVTVAGGGDEHD